MSEDETEEKVTEDKAENVKEIAEQADSISDGEEKKKVVEEKKKKLQLIFLGLTLSKLKFARQKEVKILVPEFVM